MATKRTKVQKEVEKKTFQEEVVSQLLALSTSGLGLVAALAWNETIQQVVKEFIEPRVPGSGVFSRLIYALIVTLLAVTVTYQLSKISSHLQSQKK